MRSAKRSQAFRVGVGVAVLAVACATSSAGASPRHDVTEPTLRVGVLDPINVNPLHWYDAMYTFTWVYEDLFRWNANDTFSPALATSWQWTKGTGHGPSAHEDFMFTLRRNARFSDGTPVTAQAVKKSYIYVNAYDIKSGSGGLFQAPLRSIQTVGKWTVIIHLKSPQPDLLRDLVNESYATPIISPRCVALAARNPALLDSQSCGAGPYMVDVANTETNDHATLIPNPHYYERSEQRWGKIYIKSIPNVTTLFQALKAGQFDGVVGDTGTAQAAKAGGFTVVHGPGFNVFLVPNFDKIPSISSRLVRQALNYAVDRMSLSKAFGLGYATPTSAIATIDGNDTTASAMYPYDPAKARALLAAAGHSNDVTLSILAYGPWGSVGTPLIQAVSKYFAAIGINASVVQANDIASWGSQYKAVGMFEGPFGISSMFSYYTLFMTGKGNVSGGWTDPVINKLFAKAREAADPAHYWRKVTLRLTQQAYFVPLLTLDEVWFENPKVVTGGAIGRRPYIFASELVPAK